MRLALDAPHLPPVAATVSASYLLGVSPDGETVLKVPAGLAVESVRIVGETAVVALETADDQEAATVVLPPSAYVSIGYLLHGALLIGIA